MTWEQFKKQVDDELQKNGVPQSVDLWYIDVSPIDGIEIDFSEVERLGLAIT